MTVGLLTGLWPNDSSIDSYASSISFSSLVTSTTAMARAIARNVPDRGSLACRLLLAAGENQPHGGCVMSVVDRERPALSAEPRARQRALLRRLMIVCPATGHPADTGFELTGIPEARRKTADLGGLPGMRPGPRMEHRPGVS